MNFWDLNQHAQSIALLTEQKAVTYSQLNQLTNEFAQITDSKSKKLILVLCNNRIEDIVCYLSALKNKHTVWLLDEKLDFDLLNSLVETYKPSYIIGCEQAQINGYDFCEKFHNIKVFKSNDNKHNNIHPELALLLTTSGSTGSSKLVRLSYNNLQSNAQAIMKYLKIGFEEKPITTLPMQYTYGLSVINSHLLANAQIILTDESIVSKNFWELFKKHNATSIAGVPYIYQTLKRLKIETMQLSSLKTLTQAGGRLPPQLAQHFAKIAKEKGWQFIIMYGQTEATARISYLPHDKLEQKPDSIGIPIPGGKLKIDNQTSELIYTGPNVMLGYATCIKDLEKGDEMHSILNTGDFAKVDEDGYYYITGRKSRFIKMYGVRTSLDDIEKFAENSYNTSIACTGTDGSLVIAFENCSKEFAHDTTAKIAAKYKLHLADINTLILDKIPRLSNGKTDYSTINEMT